jgi:pilus assembly protein CpaB
VTPKQAEVLVKAREEGKIQLTLRNPLDQSHTADESELVAAAPPPSKQPTVHRAQPAKVRPADPGTGVTIIRGTNVHNSESAT